MLNTRPFLLRSLLGLSAFAALSCASAPQPSPVVVPPSAKGSAEQSVNFEQLAKAYLPGKWTTKYEVLGYTVLGTIDYDASGSVRYDIVMEGEGESQRITSTATWSVVGNVFRTVVTETSDPAAMPVGTESADQINYLREDEFSYRDNDDGMQLTIVEKKTKS